VTVNADVRRYRPLFSKLPADRATRWHLLQIFIAFWYRPVEADDGFPEAEIAEAEAAIGFRFPLCLREWLLFAGRRRDIWATQDHLYSPHLIAQLWLDPNYERSDDYLVFYGENQGCERWGIRKSDCGLEDPPVWSTYNSPLQVSDSLSAFVVQTALRELLWSAPFHLQKENAPGEEVLKYVRRRYMHCDVSRLYWEPLEPMEFFEGVDMVLVAHNELWIYGAARSIEARDELIAAGLHPIE
jgi:hypothetical protein